MQPYIFPYLGYFQLISAVDTFVFYDDVNFIKQGWINRNQILVNGQKLLFSVPIKNISSFRLINQTEINEKLYPSWRIKFLKSIEQNYGRAPHFGSTYALIESVLDGHYASIAQLATSSVRATCSYLDMKRQFFESSENFSSNQGFHRADRLIEITRALDGTVYVNPAGGTELYQKRYFKDRGIDLFFIKNYLPVYKQFKYPFVPGLSIIDVLMFNTPAEVTDMLAGYELE